MSQSAIHRPIHRSIDRAVYSSRSIAFPITSGISFRCLATGSYIDSGTTLATTFAQRVQQVNDVNGSNHATQATLASRLLFVPSCALTGKPALRSPVGATCRLVAPSVSVNSRQFSFYAIMRPMSTGADSYGLFNFGNSAALSSPMVDSAAGKMRAYLPLNTTASQFYYGNPLVVVVTGSASEIATYINTKKQALAAFDAATVSGGALFSRGDGFPFKGADIYEFGLISETLVDTDVADLVSYASSEYGVRTSWSNFFGASGDSLTEGVSDANLLGKPHPLIVADALGPNWKSCNGGLASMETSALTTMAVWSLNQQVAGVSGRKVFCYYGGTNDFGVSDVTVATLQSRLTTLLSQQTTAGFNETYVATLTPRNDASWSATKETKRLEYNTWLRAQAGTLFTGLIELANAPELDDYADTTYYDPDQLHYKQPARDVIAQLTLAAINP